MTATAFAAAALIVHGTDCPGERGSLAFTITATRAGTLTASVGDLAGPGTARIPRDRLDVRVVDRVLEPLDRLSLAAGEARELRVQYSLPSDCPPGVYRGRVRAKLDRKTLPDVDLELDVRSFVLPAAAADFYMYAETPASLSDYRTELADQRDHGMTMGFVPDPVSREGDLDRAATEAYLDVYKETGFPRNHVRMDLWNRITSEWLNDPDKTIGMWGPWFRYYAFSEPLDRRYVDTVTFLRDACAKRGLELVLGVGDEPGSHAWTIPAIKHYLDLIRREAPGVRLDLTVGGGWAMGEKEEEHWRGRLDSWTTNRWLADKLEVVRRENPAAAVNLYNMGGAGSGPGGTSAARMVFGFFAWKAGANGVAQWVYHHAATPEHDYVRAGHGPWQAPLPTPRWEAVREGTKEFRMIALLESKLANSSGSVADEARRTLRDIADRIELKNTDYDAVSGGRVASPPVEVLDQWRARVADLIERL